MRKLIYLVALSMLVMLMLAPVAMAESHGEMEQPKMEEKSKMKEMPKTGGPAVGSLLPVGGLLIGSGIMAFAVLRRR